MPDKITPLATGEDRIVFRARILCEPSEFVASRAEVFIGEYRGKKDVYLRLRGAPRGPAVIKEYELILPFTNVSSTRVVSSDLDPPPAAPGEALETFEVYPD